MWRERKVCDMSSRRMKRGRTAIVLGALVAVAITASANALATPGDGPEAPIVITSAKASLITGTGQRGTIVSVANDQAEEVCSRRLATTAWQCVPSSLLAPGSTIIATMTDREGNELESTTAVVDGEPGDGDTNETFNPNFDNSYGGQYMPVDPSGKAIGGVDPDTQANPDPNSDSDELTLGAPPNLPAPGDVEPASPTLEAAPAEGGDAVAPRRLERTAKTSPAPAEAAAVGDEPFAESPANTLPANDVSALESVPGNRATFEDAAAEPEVSIAPLAEPEKAAPIVTDHVEVTPEYNTALTGDIGQSLAAAVDLAAAKAAFTGEVLTVTTVGGLLQANVPDWAKQAVIDSNTAAFELWSLDARDYSAEQLATELADPIEFNQDAINLATALHNGSAASESFGAAASGWFSCNGDWQEGTISKSKALDWNKQYKFDKSGHVGAMQWAMKAYIYGALHGSVSADIAYETKRCLGVPYAIRFKKATLKANASGHLQAFLQAKAQVEYQDDFSYTLPYKFGDGFTVLGFKFEASAQVDITGGAKISAAVDAQIKMRLDAIGIIDYQWECLRGESCKPVKQDWKGNVTKSDDTGASLNIDLGIAPYIEVGVQADITIIAPILVGRVAVVIAAPVHLYAAACLFDINNDGNFDGSYGAFIDVSLDLYGYYYYNLVGFKGWGTFPLGGPSTNPNDVSPGWRRVTTDADSSSMYHIWPGHNSPKVDGVKLTKTTKVLFSRPLLNASPGVLRPIVRQLTGGISVKPQTCYPFNSGKPKYQIDFDGIAGPRAPEPTLYDESVVPFPAGTTPTGPANVAVRIIGDDMGRDFNTVRHPSRWVEIAVTDPATLPPDVPGQIEPDVQITKNAKSMQVNVSLDKVLNENKLIARITVTTPDGKPIKGATVNGTWKKATGLGFTTTNDAGVAELSAQFSPMFNPTNEASSFTVDAVEADGFGKLAGNLTATWFDITRWGSNNPTPGSSLVNSVLKKTPVRMAVSLGDSYMSGEGGRWAGNAMSPLWWNNTDRGSSAYSDNFGGGETIANCHRSKSALIHFQASSAFSTNFACSGAETTSALDGTSKKPGVDFGANGVVGQLTMLKEFANRYDIGVIELSIGGNDFGFGSIVKECLITDCRTSAVAREALTKQQLVKDRIVTSIMGIKTAMAKQSKPYNIVVHNYPGTIASGAQLRPGGKGSRQDQLGCGFSDEDAAWANDTLLPAVNKTVADAVTQVRSAGNPNVYLLDISQAFAGHRLCEKSAYLVGEYKRGYGWVKGTDRDMVEWMTQIRTATAVTERFMLQEGLHPNYWGQLALRSCARQMYGMLSTVSTSRSTMHCRPGGLGVLAVGNEPTMTLSPV
jgi:hypothetical protein